MKLEFRFFERIYEGPARIPREGYLFAYRIQGIYRFGRIIRTNVTMGKTPYEASAAGKRSGVQLNLTYFYSPEVTTLETVPQLRKEDLLMPPQLIWENCWMHGTPVFLPIKADSLKESDYYRQHCFKDGSNLVDEYGQHIEYSDAPCNKYHFILLERLETILAEALGLLPNEDDFPKFLEALRSFPTITTLNVPQPKDSGIDVTISIPLQQLVLKDIDMYELEDDLIALLYPKFGKWVETITGSGDRHIIFEIRPKQVDAAVRKIDSTLKSLGLDGYQVSQATPD